VGTMKFGNIIIGIAGFSVSVIGTEGTGIGGGDSGNHCDCWRDRVSSAFVLIPKFLTTALSLNLLIKERRN